MPLGKNRDFFHTGLQIGRSDIRTMMDGMGPGDHFYVDYREGADGHDGNSWKRALRTYGEAIRRVKSNNNDIIHIDGDSEIIETAMVTVSKNRVHTIGHNGALGHFGQGARISCALATGVLNIATILNTGIRNTFTGIKVLNANTVSEGLYAFAESGEYTRFHNTEFYKVTDLDVDFAAEFLHNGDSTMFYDCTFGSLANIIADNKIRPNVLCSTILANGQLRDSYFENCLFFSKAGGTEHVAVYGANSTDVERMLMFKECTFINNPLSAATPSHAVTFGAAQTEGVVFLKNCSAVDFGLLCEAARNIFVDGPVPTFATTGLAVTT